MEFQVYRNWQDLPQGVGRDVEAILTDSFPEEECRSLPELRRSLGATRLALLTLEEGERALGFITVWDLDSFVFLEYFAVAPWLRGKGCGQRMLDYVGRHWKKPALLEVEYPESDTRKRRIRFYERNGFCLNPYPYLMPCLHGNGPAVPLLLMTRPAPLTLDQARKAVMTLYDTAYRGKPRPALF